MTLEWNTFAVFQDVEEGLHDIRMREREGSGARGKIQVRGGYNDIYIVVKASHHAKPTPKCDVITLGPGRHADLKGSSDTVPHPYSPRGSFRCTCRADSV